MGYLFGYGSLLSPESATRTLLRPVAAADLRPARLRGFRRTWTAAAEVFITGGNAPGPHTALFLDLSPAPGVACNGVLLQVAEAEWARLDLRERMYERAAVRVEAGGATEAAFTYLIPEGEKRDEGVVLEGYLDILRQALRLYPEDFGREFWAGTDEPARAVVTGDYVFRDQDQNRAAGRG